MNKTDAEKSCSNRGNSVHLPLPRFEEENNFYQTYFGDDGLWLALSETDQRGIFKNHHGDNLYQIFETIKGEKTMSKFNWTNTNFTLNTEFNGLKMSSSGEWKQEDQSRLLDTICIYDIIPKRCSKCLYKDFCRYKDHHKLEVICICPDMTDGDNCEIDLCRQCLNGGQCLVNEESNEIECICPYPFHGKYCESSKNNILNSIS